jgi:hypothetical protein
MNVLYIQIGTQKLSFQSSYTCTQILINLDNLQNGLDLSDFKNGAQFVVSHKMIQHHEQNENSAHKKSVHY